MNPLKFQFSHTLLLLVLALAFSSCKKDEENSGLVNTWKLIEVLADPGDGSGTFQPVNSDKTVSFYEDGSVVSNGQMCSMSIAVDNGSTGTYSESEMAITPENCGFAAYVIYYEFESSNLILNHPCIEACREKYELVD